MPVVDTAVAGVPGCQTCQGTATELKLDGVGAGAGAEVDVDDPDVDVLPEDVVLLEDVPPEEVLDPPEVGVVIVVGEVGDVDVAGGVGVGVVVGVVVAGGTDGDGEGVVVLPGAGEVTGSVEDGGVVTDEGLPPVCGVADATVPVPDGSVADVVVPPEPPPPHAERTAAPKIAARPVRTR